MKKFLFLLCLCAVTACGVDDSGTNPEKGTVLVDIRDGGFSPDTITVQVGTYVRWTNRGTQWHGVASPLFESQNLYLNWWFEARFDNPGTYDYYCQLHVDELGNPTKEGTVIVE